RPPRSSSSSAATGWAGGACRLGTISMVGERQFVDTNILVYAYDADAGEKHAVAKEVLVDLWSREAGAVSTQVLQELYVTVTRKLPKPLGRPTARSVIDLY